MANCHSLFQDFNKNLNITKSKKDSLIKSKDTLREKIKKYFKDNHPGYTPEFFIQGSYKMNTMIRTKDDTCDLDDGIHFKIEPDVTPTTLMNWVYNAVKDHTSGGQQKRKKCIRVIYKNDYHIDLPIYKQGENDDYPYLAIKDKAWDEEESDPKGFVDWYNNQKTDQMTRITKYLKSWGDQDVKKMPSGLAMTLFSEKYLVSNDRDDIALRDTLIAIENGLLQKWEAIMPTKPCDDVLANYDDSFKDNFLSSLNNFINDAKAAISEKSQFKASKLWRKHLGQRFPLGEEGDSNENKNALIGIAKTSVYKPYLNK